MFQIFFLILCMRYTCHVTLLIAQKREELDIEDFQNIKTSNYPTSIESLASTITLGAAH